MSKVETVSISVPAAKVTSAPDAKSTVPLTARFPVLSTYNGTMLCVVLLRT
ncbi:MAG: hypothetical protein AB7V48_12255 [Sedimentibacter sp.]